MDASVFVRRPFFPVNSENLNIHGHFAGKKSITERIRKRTRRVRRNPFVLLTSRGRSCYATRPTSNSDADFWNTFFLGVGIDLLRSGRASCHGFPLLLNVPERSENNYDWFLSTKMSANRGRRFSLIFRREGASARFRVSHRKNNEYMSNAGLFSFVTWKSVPKTKKGV